MVRRVVALTLVTSLLVGAVAVTGSGGAAVATAGTGAAPDSDAANASADRVLVVADALTGERILVRPVANGTHVALEYTHSVEQSRVYEQYTVRGDRLVETRMEFESYGWGLPADANVTEVDGTFVYDPPGSLARLTVAPGDVAGHELHVGDDSYDLVTLTDERSVDVHLVRQCDAATATGGESGG